MPWKAASAMSLRLEFVELALADGANIRSLCRRFGVSAMTAYKWIHRYRDGGSRALEDRSRRPQTSPRKIAPRLENAIISLRLRHPAWGGRKIRQRLVQMGWSDVPSASTVTAVFRRQQLMDRSESRPTRDLQRFEATAPNLLWQMDFKGDFALHSGRCYPLTMLDDHSRFAVGLYACANQQVDTVQGHLCDVFRRYGLPQRILTDNGGPWGSCGNDGYTSLEVWLIRLGISLSHSRVCHPQTLGKDERFHRTLGAEVLAHRAFVDLQHCQQHFDAWRDVYNLERPHQALNMAVPASRYQPSIRAFPEILPPIAYGPDDIVRKVQAKGEFSFHGRCFKVGKAFAGLSIALRPTLLDGQFDLFFCYQPIAQISLNNDITHS
ncbi:MAG: IS481 family transposase [Bacteroidota bacterium]